LAESVFEQLKENEVAWWLKIKQEYL
jgi:hypothetical protein